MRQTLDLEIVKKRLQTCAQNLSCSVSDLQYSDFVDYLKRVSRVSKEEIARFQKAIQAAGGYTTVRDSVHPVEKTDVLRQKTELRQVASLNRSKVTEEIREQLFMDQFEQRIAQLVPKIKTTMGGWSTRESKESVKRKLFLFLSDLHIGARLDKRELLTDFGTVETSRRIANVVKVTCSYKKDHRKETTLSVILGGDLIQGMLNHDPRDGAPLAEQWCEALSLLIQALGVLASEFPRVEVYCTPGNHDRNVARHVGRAIHEKWDSFATMLYYGIKQAMTRYSNVSVTIPRTAWIDLDVFGERAYITHGDTNLNPGNPGDGIDTAKLEVQMNRINIGEVQAGRKPYKLFAVGHVHFGGFYQIKGGYYLITNPSLVQKDSYGLQFGHGQAHGQTLWEAVPDHIVGDYRLIDLDPKVDSDESLDKIIRPFTDF